MGKKRESRFFRAWATLVLRFRWLVVPLLFVGTVLAAIEVKADLQVETSPEYFAQGNSDASETLDAFRADFGRDDQYLILVSGDVFSADFLHRLETLHRDLEASANNLSAGPPAQAPAGPANAAEPPPTPAAGDEDGWGDQADDAAGFGQAPTDDDGWGDQADDAAGFGAAAPIAGGDDGWGDQTDDAAGFGQTPSPVTPPPPAARDAAPQPSSDSTEHTNEPVIDEVISLVNFRQTVFEAGGLRVRPLMETFPTDLAAFKAKVLADPSIVGSVVGADGKHAVLAVRSPVISNEASRELFVELSDFVAPYQAPGFDVVVTGLPALEYAVSSSLMRDLRVLILAAFSLMGIVLFVLFRHPVAVIAPLVVVGLSIIYTLAFMSAVGTPVTLLTNIVPAFLICVGLGDSVHVQSVFRDLRASGVAHHEAIVSAVGSTGLPVLFTTLTTMVGLLSFRSASTLGIQELGTVAAFGVFVALLMSVTVIPITSTLIKTVPARRGDQAPQEKRRDAIDRLLSGCTNLSTTPGKRWRLLAATLALLAIAGVGISLVKVFHDPLTWLPTGHPTQTSIRELDQNVGGTSNIVVVFDAPGELGVKDRDLLLQMEALERHIQGFEHPDTGEKIVGNSMSLVGIVKETNRALHEGRQEYYKIPDTQRGVSDALLLFESASPKDLRRVATADLKKTHITFRLDWMDATSLLPLDAHVAQGIRELVSDDVQATITGTAYSLVSTVGALIGDLMKSFGLAVFVIASMMAALLRNVKLAAIALVPNLLPVAFILGFMGFVGIPIDMATLLIASIVIGIAVDTTIHYLHQYRVVFLQTQDVEAGITHALDHAGRALVGTSVILAIGFGAYLASSLANVQRFGILVAVACISALFTNLILVPAMLRTVHGGPHAR